MSTRVLTPTWLMLTALVGFGWWSAWFEIDQTVRAQGQLIPVARTQLIQAADGGVLSAVLVQEGQHVERGQVLATLERDRAQAAYLESGARDAALNVALLRAKAEAQEQQPDFGSLGASYPHFVADQRALFEQRRRSLQEELATLGEGLSMAREELAMTETLLRTGDVSRLEVMRATRQVGEAQGRINAVRNKYRQDARMEAARLEEELAANGFRLDERKSVLSHTELTAPTAGIVKYLKYNSVGAVLRAGDELMHISPTQGGLLVEIKVNPADIGQLTLGMPAIIRLDAFDFSLYGSLQGTLSYISADTLTEAGANGQGPGYYRAHVRLPPQASGPGLAGAALRPGMTATVDLVVQRRSILHYISKPIHKAFSGAMNER